jgi:hypothetical protein
MTAKEILLERAPHWTEEQAARALRAAEGDGTVDDWGDVEQLLDSAAKATMRDLAEEERAAGHEPW